MSTKSTIKNTICFLSIILALFLALPVQADLNLGPGGDDQLLPVKSLEEGNCWVGEEKGKTKLAVFSQGRSFIWDKKDLHLVMERWQEEWKSSGLIPLGLGPYSLHLHCRSDGASLYVNFHQSEPQVCLHLQLEFGHHSSRGEILTVKGAHPFHEGGKGFCEGQERGKLLVAVSKENPKHRTCLEKLFHYEQETEMVEKVIAHDHFLLLQMAEAHHFQERELKEMLLQEEACQGILSDERIEYSSLRIPVGTAQLLGEGHYFP